MHAMEDLVSDRIEKTRDEFVHLCKRLVEAPSPNPPGDTRDVASVICEFLDRRGLPFEVIAKDPMKPNIVASCKGAGPGLHIVMNGHMDTVGPGDETDWSVPIFELTRRNGRLTGLGTGNMKAALAAFCMAFETLAECRDRWSGTVTLTAVSDEVVLGENGSTYLLSTKPELTGDAFLSGEGPGFMDLAVAEKGLLWIEVEARVASGQGMVLHRNGSAIARLARAILDVDTLNAIWSQPPPELADLSPERIKEDLRCSANVGVVNGGTFISQVASCARAEVDVRFPPGLDLGQVEQRLKKFTERNPEVSWRILKGWDANWTSPESSLARSVSRAALAVRGSEPRLAVRLPASDAHHWRARGIPAVCYGPQPTLVAGVDDFVFEQDVIDCAKVYALSTLSYLSSHGKQDIAL